MLLALWAAATTRQRLILHHRIEPFGTRAAAEALTPSFSLPPPAFDYHEPALSGPFTSRRTTRTPSAVTRTSSGARHTGRRQAIALPGGRIDADAAMVVRTERSSQPGTSRSPRPCPCSSSHRRMSRRSRRQNSTEPAGVSPNCARRARRRRSRRSRASGVIRSGHHSFPETGSTSTDSTPGNAEKHFDDLPAHLEQVQAHRIGQQEPDVHLALVPLDVVDEAHLAISRRVPLKTLQVSWTELRASKICSRLAMTTPPRPAPRPEWSPTARARGSAFRLPPPPAATRSSIAPVFTTSPACAPSAAKSGISPT
jgi:hypothetical protein